MTVDCDLKSWGGLKPAHVAGVVAPAFRTDRICLSRDSTWLPRGNGGSYGDCAINDGGGVVAMRGLNRFVGFDPESGLLAIEAGVLLSEIVAFALPRGWFLPVTPGTKFVTVGGALANDVHGKDHHVRGTFGEWVRSFDLWRSDGVVRVCSLSQNPELFRATIGGMGLTGLILSVTIQLRRISSPAVLCHTQAFETLADFMALDADSRQRSEMTVAWFDCLSKHTRGIYMAGDFADSHAMPLPPRQPVVGVPLTPPVSLLSGPLLSAFNRIYYAVGKRRHGTRVLGIEPYFYPLDKVGSWNRLYGPKGFVQLQFVVPFGNAEAAIEDVLGRLRRAQLGSFLAVLKTFGHRESAGLMSFPKEGVTIALDLPRSASLPAALAYADDAVRAAGGRFYAAKDSYSTPATFRAGYPNLDVFKKYIDPLFSSNLWRRLSEECQ